MRRLTALIAAALLAAAGTVAVVSLSSGGDAGDEPASEAERELRELQEPSDAMLARQLFGSDGVVPTDVFPQARTRALALQRETERTAPAVAAAQWKFDGPSDIGGRVLDVAVDPDVADRIFIATATGGVWRSDDAGRTFASTWPEDETQAIGALTITKSGTLFAGTGESGPGGGSITYGGTGVYRSRDRGRTWERVGLEDTSRISRIVVDPSDERRIFVAASGPLYAPSDQRGLYLSEDGGDTWRKVLAGDNATTGAADVAVDPHDPKRVYATLWDHQRTPDQRKYEGVGSGLYRSDDRGRTWSRIATGVLGPSPALGRMGVTTGHGADGHATVWVIATTVSGAFGGLYKSSDGGNTFTPRAAPDLATASFVYGWWFGRVWVDPRDNDHVFVAGVNLAESKDGGDTWGSSDGPHADQHAMAWDPKQPGRVYLGNDGGVYRSEQDGASATWTFAEEMPFSQLYGIDVSAQDPARKVAGLQDNGANRSWGGDGKGWNEYVGGDGQRVLIKPTDQNLIYGCYQYGECSVSTDGGDTTSSFTQQVVSSRKNWFTPIEFDPEDPSTIYTGGEIMSRSDDDAGSFTPISPELSNGPGKEINPLFRNYGTLTTIAPAGKSTGTIYAGTDDGNLWYTHSGGGLTGWTKASDPDLPKAWITRVEVDRRNPDVAYVTYSGFRQGDAAAYLLRTRDGGRSWANITGDLPRAPLNDVNVIGDDLVVASDVGVFLSRDGGAHWLRLGRGLPMLPVFELKLHAPTRTLYAGTFGRGFYKLDLRALDATPRR